MTCSPHSSPERSNPETLAHLRQIATDIMNATLSASADAADKMADQIEIAPVAVRELLSPEICLREFAKMLRAKQQPLTLL